MKKSTLHFVLFTAILIAAGFGRLLAQPCTMPCSGAWTEGQQTYTTTHINGHIGCPYRITVKYRYRSCMGVTQVDLEGGCHNCGYGFIIENLGGAGCDLHCPDVPAIEKDVYANLLTWIGTPILKFAPSSCYYLGTITVPAGAERCYGMTPGTKRYISVPCDTNGCCYSQLTPLGIGGIQQTVITSTACPAPRTYRNWNVKWSCDILGGGSMTYNVTFTADSPMVCQLTCDNGPYYFGAGSPKEQGNMTVIPTNGNSDITGFNVFPNPAGDYCNISFNSEKQGEDIRVELADIVGKTIIRLDVVTIGGNQSIKLDTKNLATGIYTCKLTYGNQVYTGKIIK